MEEKALEADGYAVDALPNRRYRQTRSGDLRDVEGVAAPHTEWHVRV